MKYVLTFCMLLISLCIISPVQSWEVYNRSTAADSDLLDGLDSTAFTLNSSFAAYTSTAGGGVSGNFVSYTTIAGSTYANITTNTVIDGQIKGGKTSYITGIRSGIFSGYSNVVIGEAAVITGGNRNRITGDLSVIGGGNSNTVTANTYAFIGGGFSNLASGGIYPTICGGQQNEASGDFSFIGGGNLNDATGQYATVTAGLTNKATGIGSFVGGGQFNEATADYVTIAGGHSINIAGAHSSACGGKLGTLTGAADRTFIDIYGDAEVTVTQADAHIIYGAAGFEKKVGIQILTPQHELDVNGDMRGNGGVIFSGQTTVMSNYSASLSDYTIFADATSNPFTVVIDATLAKGHHIRIKKVDSTANEITLDGLDGQTINGSTTFIIREGSIMVVSDGTNWEKLQATPVEFYGDMHVHDNILTTVMETQNSPHHVRQFSLVDAFGMTFNEGSTGPISAFAEYSTIVAGTTKVTDVAHALTTGDILTINGTTSYNGIFEITIIDSDNYYIVDTFVADDATGNWTEGDYLLTDPGTNGVYKLEFHGFGLPDAGTNQDYEFEIFADTTPSENLEAKRRFANSSDIGTFGGGGIVTLADGQRLTLAIIPLSGTQDFTLEHLNIALHRIR